jgi:hypothetical protein
MGSSENRSRSLAIAALVLLGASGASSVWWAPSLGLTNLSQANAALGEKVSLPKGAELTLAKQGATRNVRTCKEYLNAKADGFGPMNNLAYALESRFIDRCSVLRLLTHARPAQVNYFGAEEWTPAIAQALPPLLYQGFPRERARSAKRAAAEGERWTSFDRELQFKNDHGVDLTAYDDNFVFSLEIVARGDFNGDGIEDFAVNGSVNARKGTFRYFQFLVLTRLKPNGPVRVLPSDGRVRGTRADQGSAPLILRDRVKGSAF